MSSLTSSTKVPSQPRQVVYYVPTKTASPDPVEIPVTNTSTEADNKTTSAQAREQNLLTRERGAIGTIKTGFRGLLSTLEHTGKSLLGQ